MKLSSPNEKSSLQAWLDYQLAMHPVEIDMGLERVMRVAQRLNLTNFGETRVITVAGTNGKGSTCSFLESILRCDNRRVGVYSSPHMLRYNERVRIDGQDCVDELFVDSFHQIECAREEISLTYFEFATLAGLLILNAAQLDVVILEVGLGGRLDATNIVDADISVITSIDIDHQSFLGDTRELVGFEKAGVFRENRLAVVGEPDVPNSVLMHAEKIGAHLYRVGHDFSYLLKDGQWQYLGRHKKVPNLEVPRLPLPNAATSVAVIEQGFSEISSDIIKQGLARAQLDGRFEIVAAEPAIILDVAHNPHAAKYLASQLEHIGAKRVFAVCGMLEDKDIKGVLSELVPFVDDWSLIDLDVPRGASAHQLALNLPKNVKYSEFDQLFAAWKAINQQITVDDMVIIFGSFYTVSAFKSLMQQEATSV